MNLVEKNIDKIHDLCILHNVRHLYVFGSVLTNDFDVKSDLDFIVDFEGVEVYDYADNYFGFKDSLEKLFSREVDLLEEKAIKNPYLKQTIDSSKQLVYG